MSGLQLFQNDEFGELRTVVDGDKVLFCAKDVATALGYVNPKDAVAKHCKGVAIRYPLETAGGMQEVRFITEGDFYRLVVGSKLESAQRFESWVFDDVLPSIRRNGAYATEATIDSIIADPDNGIRLLQALKSERERGRKLALENASLRPKADFYDRVMESDGLISVRQAAKVLKSFDNDMGEKRLRECLRQRGMVEKRTNHATAVAIERNYLKERTFTITHSDGSKQLSTYGCLTPKGLDWCIRNFCNQTRLEVG